LCVKKTRGLSAPDFHFSISSKQFRETIPGSNFSKHRLFLEMQRACRLPAAVHGAFLLLQNNKGNFQKIPALSRHPVPAFVVIPRGQAHSRGPKQLRFNPGKAGEGRMCAAYGIFAASLVANGTNSSGRGGGAFVHEKIITGDAIGRGVQSMGRELYVSLMG